jgi:hypothetical protein
VIHPQIDEIEAQQGPVPRPIMAENHCGERAVGEERTDFEHHGRQHERKRDPFE